MKLRNIKTGEIVEDVKYIDTSLTTIEIHYLDDGVLRMKTEKNYHSFLQNWEDYDKPKEPLIKDEKIRKIVRALFDVWRVEDVKIDSNKYFLVTTIEAIGKGWKLEIPSININGVFKPTELCGEEEE